MIFVVYIQPLYVCVLICLCFCSCNWVLPTGPTPCCVCDITGIKRDWIWISYICKWIVSQYWILWCNCQSSLCETFDCWTFCCVSTFNLLDGQCLDYVILCDYLCCMWIISQCEFYDAFGSLAFMVPLIVETFSVVSHLLIWLPGSV